MLSSTEKKKSRQEKILLSLDKLVFASREHLQLLHGLGTDRNALKVLNRMKDFLHIKMHNGKYVYYLNNTGRDLIGSDKDVKWSLAVDHHLLRNDMYLYFNRPQDWRIEEKITFKYQSGLTYKETSIIPDATFTHHKVFHFLEVDRTQSMAENKKKIKQYELLSPAIEKQYKHKPVLVFYTTIESRREILSNYCAAVGMLCMVFTKEDLR